MSSDTLIVAPLTDGEYADKEISSLVNILDADLLLGSEATSTRLLEKLSSQKWRILWFVAHGEPFGIQLSDGLLDSSTLTSFIKGATPELVFLNTCSSLQVAMDVHNEVPTNFVCTVQETPDSVAFFTGKQFANAISSGKTYHAAYQSSKPGQNRNYIFLARLTQMSTQGSESHEDNQLQNELKRLIAIIDGDQRWNQRGLISIVTETEDRLDEMIVIYTMLRNSVIALIVINLAILATIIVITVGS